MACVLLRRVFLQLEYNELSAGVEDGILRPCKAQLLQALSSEPVATIRRKIGDAVAELARSSIGTRVCVCACLYERVSG